MNYLSGKSCYLAGPIKECKDDGVLWRKKIGGVLKDRFKIKVLDPTKIKLNGFGEIKDDKKYFSDLLSAGKFDNVKKDFFCIVKKDLHLVDSSNLMIFYYLPTISTVGGIHELVVAQNEKKPILMYVDKENYKYINPWILTFVKTKHIFNNWNKMFKFLDKIDKHGVTKNVSSHWMF